MDFVELPRSERLRKGPTRAEHLFWWLCRAILLFGVAIAAIWRLPNPPAFIANMQSHVAGVEKLLPQMLVYFAFTFVWEFYQFLPKKSVFRHLPPLFQDFLSPFCIATGFCGAFLNFYYRFWWWDKLIHCIGAAFCVLAGYEIACALQSKYKMQFPLQFILLFSFCTSFMVCTFWELWEFSFDQFVGGDTQHWNVSVAASAGIDAAVFPPPAWGGPNGKDAWQWEHRWALMDTMGDMISNTVGSLFAVLMLRIWPFRHRKNTPKPTQDLAYETVLPPVKEPESQVMV